MHSSAGVFYISSYINLLYEVKQINCTCRVESMIRQSKSLTTTSMRLAYCEKNPIVRDLGGKPYAGEF